MNADRSFTIFASGDSSAFKTLGGHSTGVAKTVSRASKPLEAGPTGVIPEGSYYVYAPHKDSLDSRYAIVGWVTTDDIIGRSFSLF